MIHLSKATIRYGFTDPITLPPLNWITQKVSFPANVFQSLKATRVFITGNADTPFNEPTPGAAAVCLATALNLNPPEFILRARNASQQQGDLRFSWLVLEEGVDQTDKAASVVRMGQTPPQSYTPPSKDAFDLWWQTSPVAFTPPPLAFSIADKSSASFLLTATDPFGSFSPQAAAVSGTVRTPAGTGFQLAGLTADSAIGSCAFNYVAFSHGAVEEPALVIDSGVVGGNMLSGSDLTPGQWSSIGVAFSRRFVTPPLVFVTANDIGLDRLLGAQALIGLATRVTADYFVLSARNCDTGVGGAGFYWMAIGCAAGCGQGNTPVT